MHPSPETRSSLLLRMRNSRDGQAWAQFLELYEPLVYRLARGKGLQDADARDLTQQVLMAVAERVEDWNPDRSRGSFRGWLYRVARNLIVNLLVQRERHPQATGDSNVQQWINQQPAPAADESALFDLEYRRQLFRWAARHIRGEFRPSTWDAFWRTSVEGCAIKRAAEELELSVGAVYIARSRVLARLRQKIEACDEEL